MKLIYGIILLSFASCAHHHKGADHHHHSGKSNYTKAPSDLKVKYDKECAESIKEGDKHIAGKEEFQLQHGGHFYYFSSQEKMDLFKKDLEKNIGVADQNWKNRP